MLSCMVRNVYKNTILGPYSVVWRNIYTKDNIFNTTIMMNSPNIRWAFNAKTWMPKETEILKASSYIQPEEKDRISRFIFINDAKSSLLGRLMMRKCIHLLTSIPYNEVRLGRDSHGKPYLLGAGDVPLSFNVSHQGDYVVLAANTKQNIGVDIMKNESPVSKSIPEFFRLMTRQFSNQEWETIHSFPSEMEQVACFYRNWCLKESYVKNTGFGITVPLQDISFAIKTLKMEVGKFVTDTALYVNGALKHDWLFEETLLDEKHCVAVSLQIGNTSDHTIEPFKLLTFEELVNEAVPLCDCDSKFSNNFLKKQLKNF